MKLRIRTAQLEDVPHILELMREFARYEKLESSLEVTEDRLIAAMFGSDAFVEALIAFEDVEPTGYAIFYPNFLTFRGQRGYFLEDLYVAEKTRGKGLGKAMLSDIAKRARDRGFERIDFLVLDWNKSAIEFYKLLGAVNSEDESHFKFTDDAFAALCE